MRLLHTIDTVRSESGGPARSVPGLCAGLSACGADVRLLSRTPGDHPPRVPVPGFETLPPRGVCRRGIAAVLSRLQPQIVHDHGLWQPGNHATVTAARRRRIPLVIAPRGMLEPWSLQQKRWKKRLALWFYQRRDLNAACCLHATADSEAAQLRAMGFRRPVMVCPNGVDVPPRVLAAPCASGADPARTRRALFLSRIHPKKGLLELVEAWRRVNPAGWVLEIVGGDADGHRLVVEQAVRQAGLAGRVQFTGELDDDAKWDAYARADLFVLPTHSENFGIVIAEALAAGVPAITTRGAPWRELETERCGWWIDIGADALAGALREAFALPDAARGAMGLRGREHVLRCYGWQAIAEQMMAAYGWILHGGPVPACVRVD